MPFLTLILNFNGVFAQNSVENKFGSWFTYIGNYRLSNKISVGNSVNIWHYGIADNFNLFFCNIAANYHISPKLTASLSYGILDIDNGFNKIGKHTFENRIFEQIGYKHLFAKLPIDHRVRIEQRFLDRPIQKNNVLQNRIRYRIGSKINLNKILFIRFNNEYMRTIQTKESDGFDENRAYIALGFNLLKYANIQVGYLNRKIKGLNLHRLQLKLFYKVDFRNQKK